MPTREEELPLGVGSPLQALWQELGVGGGRSLGRHRTASLPNHTDDRRAVPDVVVELRDFGGYLSLSVPPVSHNKIILGLVGGIPSLEQPHSLINVVSIPLFFPQFWRKKFFRKEICE